MTKGGCLRGVNHQPVLVPWQWGKWDQLDGNRRHLNNSWLLLQELSGPPHFQRLECGFWLLAQQDCCLTVFRRMFLLGGNTRSRPEPSLESLSAFVWEELTFVSHSIKPPVFVGLVLFVAGKSHLGEEEGEEETSFEAQCGDDTWEALASPSLTKARLKGQNGNLFSHWETNGFTSLDFPISLVFSPFRIVLSLF